MKPLINMLSARRGTRLAILLTGCAGTVLLAQDPAASAAKAGAKAADTTAVRLDDYKADHSELSKAEVKAALARIDAELRHLDELADAAPTPEQKTDAKARYAALKDRRDALKKEFTRARYDAFKADLQSEMDKMSAWAKETFSTKPAATAAATATSATADATAEKIAAYREQSTDVNKAEVKASLERLDADIDLLAAKIEAVTDPVRKAELKQRLQALKQRRGELNSEFRQARYDALKADVRDEWNRLVH